MTKESSHPYRQLKGSAFVSLREVSVFVSDDLWEQVLGLIFVLFGGAEVDVDDAELDRALEDIEHCGTDWCKAAEHRSDLFAIIHNDNSKPQANLDILVPLIINDSDLPPARILIRLSDLAEMFQRVPVGSGVFARGSGRDDGGAMSQCTHPAEEIGRHQCRACMRRFWTMKAREEGLIDG